MPDYHNKHHQHCHLHFQARFLAALVLPWCFLVTPQVTALSPPSCGSGLIICSSTTWTLMMMTSLLVIFCIRGTSSDPFYSLDRRDGGSKHWTSDPWKGRATFRFRSSPSSLSLYLAYCYRHHYHIYVASYMLLIKIFIDSIGLYLDSRQLQQQDLLHLSQHIAAISMIMMMMMITTTIITTSLSVLSRLDQLCTLAILRRVMVECIDAKLIIVRSS